MKNLLMILMAVCVTQSALADDEMVTLIDTTPSEFAQSFNRLNQSEGHGVYKNIHLSNVYGERSFTIASNITLTVGAHEDGIEYIDLVCNQPKQTAEKCMRSMPWIGSAVDPDFKQVSFMRMVGENLDVGVSVGYRQNGIEYHFVPDVKKNQIRLEIHAED